MPGGRTIGVLRAERQILTSANGTSCSARHELRSRAFLFIVSAECALPTNASLFTIMREFWPMPLPLMIHSALALFAQRTRIPLLPAALASVSFGFVLVRVRVHQKVGMSPQWTAPMTSMPVRECLCRIRHGLWPLWLSAATPLGGDTTFQLQVGRQANFYHAECTSQRLYRELSRASRVAKG